MNQSRFQLKCSHGWFAAGREVASALQLLSDRTFKVFVWLCLNADRSRGAISATPAELARALGMKEHDIRLALEELQQQGVCSSNPQSVIEIRDRFWPYERQHHSAASDECRRYVAEVKRLFLQHRCVRSSFTAADEKLAISLFCRGIPLHQVEHAILLGAARKYVALLQNGQVTPISSLHYFSDLFDEVRQEISPGYWSYVAHKVKTFEKTWVADLRSLDARQTTLGEGTDVTCGSTLPTDVALKPS